MSCRERREGGARNCRAPLPLHPSHVWPYRVFSLSALLFPTKSGQSSLLALDGAGSGQPQRGKGNGGRGESVPAGHQLQLCLVSKRFNRGTSLSGCLPCPETQPHPPAPVGPSCFGDAPPHSQRDSFAQHQKAALRYACTSGCPARGSEQLPGPCRPPGRPPACRAPRAAGTGAGRRRPTCKSGVRSQAPLPSGAPGQALENPGRGRDTGRAWCSQPAPPGRLRGTTGAGGCRPLGSDPGVSSSRKHCANVPRPGCSSGFLNEARSWPGWREGDAVTLSSSKGRICLCPERPA